MLAWFLIHPLIELWRNDILTNAATAEYNLDNPAARPTPPHPTTNTI